MPTLMIRHLTQPLEYTLVWQKMRHFTDTRDQHTADELWLLEHQPVFTQGQAGKAEHLIHPHSIPVVNSDRGGQITYHGPGQLIAYLLFDIKRLGISVRPLVSTLENLIIDYLADQHIKATTRDKAPGVYVNGAKICSIGLRIRRGCTYHGIAFNVDMDLKPFSYINPCGFRGLKMTTLSQLGTTDSVHKVGEKMIPYFLKHFGYPQPISVMTQDNLLHNEFNLFNHFSSDIPRNVG